VGGDQNRSRQYPDRYPWRHTTTAPRRRGRAATQTIVASLSLVAILTAPPWLLLHLRGWPPVHLSHQPVVTLRWYLASGQWHDPTTWLGPLAVGMWLCWIWLVLDTSHTLARLTVACLRDRQALPALPRTLPAVLVAAAVAGVLAAARHTTPSDHSAPAGPGRTTGTAVTSAARVPASTAGSTTESRTYQVRSGDTLWDIDARVYHDPRRWPEVFAANQGRVEPDGQRFTNPNLIYPGWQLTLPAAAPTDAGATPPRTTPPAHPPVTPPRSTSPSHRPAPPENHHTPVTGRPSTSPPPRGEPHRDPDPVSRQPPPRHRWVVHIDPWGWVSTGLAAAVAAAAGQAVVRHRIRVRRGQRTRPTGPLVAQLQPALDAVLTDGITWDSSTGADTTARVAFAVTGSGAQLGAEQCARTGLALTGPGALGAARALLAATLTAGGPEHYAGEAEALLSTSDLHDLLEQPPGDYTTLLAGRLHVVSDHHGVLSRAEHELVYRRRLRETTTEATEIDDAIEVDPANDTTQVRASAEPLIPFLVIVRAPPAAQTPRLAAILREGASLGVIGLLLDTPDWTPTWPVAADGTLALTASPAVPTDPAVVSTLSPAALRQILTVGATAAPDLDSHRPADASLPLTAATRSHDTTPPRGHRNDQGTRSGRLLPAGGGTPAVAGGDHTDQTLPVRLQVLGQVKLAVGGTTLVKGLRSKSDEAVAFLAVHRDGATATAIQDALWPDIDTDKATNLMHTALGVTRRALREATGLADQEFIAQARRRYRLDDTLIAVDLWQLTGVLDELAAHPEDPTLLAHLAALYRGELDGGRTPGTWLDAAAEDLRRRCCHTLSRIATVCEHDRPDQALTALDLLAEHDRYNDAVFARLLRLQHHLGYTDRISSTLQRARHQMNEIGMQPTTSLLHLARTLTARGG
jgi:DNA-binding SARP family transcriptional activator